MPPLQDNQLRLSQQHQLPAQLHNHRQMLCQLTYHQLQSCIRFRLSHHNHRKLLHQHNHKRKWQTIPHQLMIQPSASTNS